MEASAALPDCRTAETPAPVMLTVLQVRHQRVRNS